MKSFKNILESSILADVEDTMKTGDLFAEVQDKLDFTAKFNKKYELDLFSKTDHCKQPIAIGDLILCEWLGAIRPGVVLAINDDKKLTVTFDGDTNMDFNGETKYLHIIGSSVIAGILWVGMISD